jgi:hypothetical protein
VLVEEVAAVPVLTGVGEIGAAKHVFVAAVAGEDRAELVAVAVSVELAGKEHGDEVVLGDGVQEPHTVKVASVRRAVRLVGPSWIRVRKAVSVLSRPRVRHPEALGEATRSN